MEYITGETLFHRLRAGPLPLPEALRIAEEVTEALEEAHSHRFVHRDLKPANVMLTRQGRAKVIDFGLAKRFGLDRVEEDSVTYTVARPGLTEHGTIIGTPDYMSPEQMRGEPDGLAALGRLEEAASLSPAAEDLATAEALCGDDTSLFRTTAGMAVACGRNWTRAEEHHQAAIHQADTIPFRVAQPQARAAYVDMLVARNEPGDAARARALLTEALAMFDWLGMTGYLRRTRDKLATVL